MLTWPHGHGDWRPFLTDVEPVFVQLAATISAYERLLISAYDEEHKAHILALLAAAGVPATQISLFCAPTNDTWARDHGPLGIIHDGSLELLDFRFNGWGGKFEAADDNRLNQALHASGAFGDVPMQSIDLVLEGGSIEVDGQGTLMTTARCLLAETRNPALDQSAIEARLMELLGIQRILWLQHAHLVGDDTDGHIDMLARFTDTGTIVYTACDNPEDEHFESHQAMLAELRSFRTVEGKPYRLLELPWPEPQFSADGERLPASYANFLIINGAVLVPTYRARQDAEALRVIGSAFTEREVIGIDCRPIIEQYGSLHCLTMQLTAGTFPSPQTN